MKPQHTKGPWKYRRSISNRFAYSLHGENDYTIMGVSNQDGLIPSESDARLIASAPELLSMLKFVADDLNTELDGETYGMIMSTISKAEGN